MAEPAKLSVVEFPTTSYADVPALMRKVADRIEAGEYGPIQFAAAVLVTQDCRAMPFMWGLASRFEILGAIEAVKDTIATGTRA